MSRTSLGVMICDMLGYRGRPTWRDMSEYVVHFTKDSPGQSAYQNMMTILHSGQLIPGEARYGAIRWADALGDTQRAVCFSEIPLDRLGRLVARRSLYGVAFKQDKIIEAGGGRVWYLDSNGSPARALTRMITGHTQPGQMDANDPLWSLTPFIDTPQENYRFEWEREWRVPGPQGMSFTPDDVAFLFLPEDEHASARSFAHEAAAENTGPAYLCPYLDPRWEDNALQEAFASV